MRVPAKDRRTSPRHPLRVPLKVRLWKSETPEHKSISRNLSLSGAHFPTELPVAIGTVIELRLKMPEEISGERSAEWRCSGHVVRIDEQGPSQNKRDVAIQFDCYEVARSALPSSRRKNTQGHAEALR